MILQGRAHAALLAALHERSFTPEQRWDRAAMAALLDMPGCFACLHEAADPWHPGRTTPRGMAMLRVTADEAELLTVAVLPAARGAGVGAALLGAAIAEAARRGAGRMFLEVAEGNAAARALYDRHGFAPVGRRRNYYPDGSHALVLSRALCIPEQARGVAP